mgnify:CR=1 FL=1
MLGIACIVIHWCCVFFFKQKTAYEMLRSLVGSEMCIRDRLSAARVFRHRPVVGRQPDHYAYPEESDYRKQNDLFEFGHRAPLRRRVPTPEI